MSNEQFEYKQWITDARSLIKRKKEKGIVNKIKLKRLIRQFEKILAGRIVQEEPPFEDQQHHEEILSPDNLIAAKEVYLALIKLSKDL